MAVFFYWNEHCNSILLPECFIAATAAVFYPTLAGKQSTCSYNLLHIDIDKYLRRERDGSGKKLSLQLKHLLSYCIVSCQVHQKKKEEKLLLLLQILDHYSILIEQY